MLIFRARNTVGATLFAFCNYVLLFIFLTIKFFISFTFPGKQVRGNQPRDNDTPIFVIWDQYTPGRVSHVALVYWQKVSQKVAHIWQILLPKTTSPLQRRMLARLHENPVRNCSKSAPLKPYFHFKQCQVRVAFSECCLIQDFMRTQSVILKATWYNLDCATFLFFNATWYNLDCASNWWFHKWFPPAWLKIH